MDGRNTQNLMGIFYTTLEYTEKLLDEFDLAFDYKNIKKFPLITTVYMSIIIINLGKILNASKCDKFGINQLKNIAKKESTKEEIEKILLEEHFDIIEKIKINRHEGFAHIDDEYYNLGFSENAIEEFRERLLKVKRFSKNKVDNEKRVDCFLSTVKKSKSIGKERYTVGDLKKDLPEIKVLLKKLNDIWDDILVQAC